MAPRPEATLLGLPGELRNQIYELIVVDDIQFTSLPCRLPSFLHVNNQIRREAGSIFFWDNDFRFNHSWVNVAPNLTPLAEYNQGHGHKQPLLLLQWLDMIGAEARGLLGFVDIAMEVVSCANRVYAHATRPPPAQYDDLPQLLILAWHPSFRRINLYIEVEIPRYAPTMMTAQAAERLRGMPHEDLNDARWEIHKSAIKRVLLDAMARIFTIRQLGENRFLEWLTWQILFTNLDWISLCFHALISIIATLVRLWI